jgi:hypothetical protein
VAHVLGKEVLTHCGLRIQAEDQLPAVPSLCQRRVSTIGAPVGPLERVQRTYPERAVLATDKTLLDGSRYLYEVTQRW